MDKESSRLLLDRISLERADEVCYLFLRVKVTVSI